MLRGEQLSSQVDINRFIESASAEEKQAVAEKLNIEEWNTLTRDELNRKIVDYVNRGGVKTYQKEKQLIDTIKAISIASTKIPKSVNIVSDGSKRYTQSDIDIAITKSGDSYRIYIY